MTQEEKAKRYDEALEELRGLLEGIREEKCKILEEDITSIFPELKDSEDEKIRKVLVYYLKNYKKQRSDTTRFYGIPTDNILAWLEKQGENHDDKYNITGIKSKHAEGKLGEMIKEIKSTDKVEPKFHEGQWIVWQDKCYKVNYNDCGYELVDQNGLSTSLEYGTIDENAHLWTIEDAKDGDVLYSPKGAGVECIFLIKGWEQVECSGKTLCSSIVYRVKEDEIAVCGLGAIWWDGVKDPFFPATKEQREQLEKAMADAGFTFDFDKKELKKIKDEIEIPYGAKDSELQEDTYYIPKGFHAEIDGDKVVIKKGEKPTDWSEKYIADVFEKVGLAKIVREQSNDALTIALQDAMIELSKVTLQPNPTAWSEEDNVMIRCITLDLELLKNRDDGKAGKAAYQSEIEWLKSIKGRVGCEANCTTTKEWKPSDEQMDALLYIFRYYAPEATDKLAWESLQTLELMLAQLKKLRGE